MNFEVLNRSHIKRNIIIGIVVVLILSAVVLTFTRAKYRVTQSMPLVSGTINFSPYDFNVVAMYLNKGDETVSTDKAPHVGYTLNSEQSTCVVDDKEVEGYEILYENGLLDFNNLSYAGTKCSVYFDLIPDNEDPVISNTGRSSTDTALTITIHATDNVGIYYYYFKLDNGDEVKTEENTYTFEGLTKGQTYSINVRVEDAAGNTAEKTEEITVGLYAKDLILANEGGAVAIEGKGTPDFSQTATIDEGMYAAEDDYGTSYYYRGAVNDNWVRFGGFYWRIIRINGDGTVRLIYSGTANSETVESSNISGISVQINSENYKFNDLWDNNAYVGYMYTEGQVHGLGTNSSIKEIIDIWYSNNLVSYSDYLEGNTGFCGDRTPSTSSSSSNGSGGTGGTYTYYGAYIRLMTNKIPSLRCSKNNDLYTTIESSQGNKILQYSIGLITVDEVAMAGGVAGASNTDYYLYNSQAYWTMSPYMYTGHDAYMFIVESYSSIYSNGVTATYGIRPVINLRADIQITGSGTTSDPFVVVTS